MANERQIAANRRNAKKSTGPQTDGGKKRAGRNAFRHGLAARMSLSDAVADQLEKLTRSIVGNIESAIKLACARAAAEASLDLARVRRAKVTFIEQVAHSADIDPGEAWRQIRRLGRHPKASGLTGTFWPIKPIESLDPMPLQEPERSAEAIRRSLPGLLKLDRYEHRASSRRDRAIRELRKLARKDW
jgi:hypothetical protein